MHLKDLQNRIGYVFRQEAFLTEALTHPSYVRGDQKKFDHNQRLEFLGDAVLQLAITECLYEHFPNSPEGDLTKLRARVVSRGHLSGLAQKLGLGPLLFLGTGEEKNAGRERESNLADAMEALLGAIHLDGGWTASRAVIVALFKDSIENLEQSPSNLDISNAKGTLQELLQKNGGETPAYECVESFGEAHDRSYTVALYWKGKELARASGKSKRAAEAEAARLALLAMI